MSPGTASLRQFVELPTFHPFRSTTISHIVQIQTQVRDAAAIAAACKRLGLAPPVNGQHKLFTSTATGLAVRLSGWSYPVVCELSTGQLQYDNYNGRWGNQEKLAAFLQSYAVEKAKIEARKQGHTVTEQSLASGEIKLTIHVSGGAA
jgi:ATP:corrinoid adenosyltransferase